jgi:hypothetical protein
MGRLVGLSKNNVAVGVRLLASFAHMTSEHHLKKTTSMTNSMNVPKIVTHPLGLAGYALALVFGLIAKFGPSEEWPWLPAAAVALALLCIVGGLILASRQAGAKESYKFSPGETTAVKQESKGDQSPNVANSKGAVNISYDGPQKPSTKKKS